MKKRFFIPDIIIKRGLPALLAAITLFPVPVRAEISGNSFIELEDETIERFGQGDYNRLWISLEKLLVGKAADPRTALYYQDLRRFADIAGYSAISGTFRKIKEQLEKQGQDPDARACRIRLLLEYEKLLQLHDPSQGRQIIEKLNPVRSWSVSGPYLKYGKADLHHPFAPEIMKDPASLPGNRVVHAGDDDGYIDLKRRMYPQSGVVYASSSFSTDRAITIHVMCEESYILFINGKAALKNEEGDSREYRILKIPGSCDISLVMKIQGSRWRFRIFCTDGQNNSITMKEKAGQKYLKEIPFSEDYPAPYEFLEKLSRSGGADPARISFWKGLFYEGLNSGRSLEEYQRAAVRDKKSIYRYYYAAALLWFSGNDPRSWRRLEAWRILNSLLRESPSFAPARFCQLLRLILEKNRLETLKAGRSLMADFPAHYSSYTRFLEFLDKTGHDTEFLEISSRFASTFPASVESKKKLATFYRDPNPALFSLQARGVLSGYRDPSLLSELVDYLAGSGEEAAALELIKSNPWCDLDLKAADILISQKKYRSARKILIRNIADGGGPSAFFRMGLLDHITGQDPAIYWERAFAMEPSLHSLQEYGRHVSTGGNDIPLRDGADDMEKIPSLFGTMKSYEQPSRILSRTRIFSLNSAASRVYCEDIIHLNNEAGIEKLGEYRIPFRGEPQPVLFRTFHDDGTYSDTYSIRQVDDSYYINLAGLRKNSIVLLRYLVDNPLSPPEGTDFLFLSENLIQSYEEPVDYFRIKITAPAEMPLSIKACQSWPVSISSEDDIKTYTFSGKNLPAVYREQHSGNDSVSLPWFSFSTMKGLDDLIEWYGGIFPDYESFILEDMAAGMKGKNIEDTVRNIYRHVSGSIMQERNILFHPENPATVLYRKSGTPEDKVFAARALLKSSGIRSYVALARSRNCPENSTPLSPDFFDSILLYVPLTGERGYWLDFLDPDYSCGTVSPAIDGSEAYLIISNSAEKRQVEGSAASEKKNTISVSMDSSGNGRCRMETELSGVYTAYRRAFSDEKYFEESLNSIYGQIFPSFSLGEYSIGGRSQSDDVFRFSAEGTVLSLAIVGENSLIMEPIKNRSSLYDYIRYPSRTHPLIISGTIRETDTYIYTLPGIFSGDEIRKAETVTGAFGSASFSFRKDSGSQKLTVTRNIVLSKKVINPEEYGEFLKFCLKVQQADSTSIILHSDKADAK
jgi:hypothetical protein